MDKSDYDLQRRVMNHMLPVHRKLGLTTEQHKAACRAIVDLLGVELLVLVDNVFDKITQRPPQQGA